MSIRTKWNQLDGNEQAAVIGVSIGIALPIVIATLYGAGWQALFFVAANIAGAVIAISLYKVAARWSLHRRNNPTPAVIHDGDDSGEYSD